MSSINRQPTGFLGFLGIKNFGRNPTSASDVLLPNWDLADLYLAQSRIYASITTEVGPPETAPEFVVVHQVPPGEVWFVHAFGLSSERPVAPASNLILSLVMFSANQGINVPLPAIMVPESPAAALGNPAAYNLAMNRTIILASGEGLGFAVNFYDGGAFDVRCPICYTIMPS